MLTEEKKRNLTYLKCFAFCFRNNGLVSILKKFYHNLTYLRSTVKFTQQEFNELASQSIIIRRGHTIDGQ